MSPRIITSLVFVYLWNSIPKENLGWKCSSAARVLPKADEVQGAIPALHRLGMVGRAYNPSAHLLPEVHSVAYRACGHPG